MAHGLKSGHIQLGPQRVKVQVVNDLYKREKLYGDLDYSKNLLRLAGDVVPTKAVDTLLHEITHHVLEGVEIKRKDEEHVVSAISQGFTGMFRDNPEWIRAILKIFREEAKCQPKSKRKQTGTQARARKQTKCRATRPT